MAWDNPDVCPTVVNGFGAYKQVTQIRQKTDEDEKTYGDLLEEYSAECIFDYLDDMLVNYYVQGLLSTSRDTVMEAIH